MHLGKSIPSCWSNSKHLGSFSNAQPSLLMELSFSSKDVSRGVPILIIIFRTFVSLKVSLNFKNTLSSILHPVESQYRVHTAMWAVHEVLSISAGHILILILRNLALSCRCHAIIRSHIQGYSPKLGGSASYGDTHSPEN